jgi:hypothetical protein
MVGKDFGVIFMFSQCAYVCDLMNKRKYIIM